MAKAKKSNVNNTINIKSLPVQCHIGASKFVNDDWGTIDKYQRIFSEESLK